MSRNNQAGFTLIEVLAAASILFSSISIALPIISLIAKERDVLQHRVIFANMLHDELQQRIATGDDNLLQDQYNEQLYGKSVVFTFIKTNLQIKGCAKWDNAKKNQEQICLYGLVEK
ncbi:type II secretion system protein [Virgibacillus sp. 179-BFC.A HS]|uniref:Type II secretion system protein n=1 Tax=Tigheibacillus jepli TaxID=3035914 RepID=A0ABU5CH13_9BACI|nr:type II secretion system protein [Virgibacillus sp. 179-BFC.A HS]MDY0405586.1 type II secretion system protein [Virgibacillus sp. 179-BFC.A HS]